MLLLPVLATALLAAGCGGSDDETSGASDWASSVCSAVTTWKTSVSAAATSVQGGNLSENSLESAVDDVSDATKTLADDLKDAGRPDTDDGQQAKDVVDQLADDVEDGVQTIGDAVDDASGGTGLLQAISTISGTLATMGDQVGAAVDQLEQLDPAGELNDALTTPTSARASAPADEPRLADPPRRRRRRHRHRRDAARPAPAPEGSYFADGDRAAGVFGVITTGFSVLLGFIIFLAFTSYDNTKQGAEAEALVVAQQFETAQFMPAAQRQELSDGLVCYARYVVHRAWPRLEAGTEGDRFNPWGVSMFRTLQQVKPNGPTEEAAFSKWLDQSSERTAARQDRVHAAQGVVPTPLWIVLFLTAAIIGAFMLFFADSGERAKTQALLIGSVVSVVTATLLLLSFLDNPYYGGVGALKPVAMERTKALLAQERALLDIRTPLPCNASGDPR